MSEIGTLERDQSTQTPEQKDVRLTVVGLSDGNEEYLNITLFENQMKKTLWRWLCLAVALGILAGSIAMAVNQFFLGEDVKTLIGFSTESAATEYNIRKLKSPGVVEGALNELGLDLHTVENIRNAISIEGLIPDSAQDHLSMYYNLMSKSGSNTGEAVRSLLNTSYRINRYIISLDYHAVKMDRTEGVNLMNALLRSYEDYFAENYNYNEAMGNAMSGIDYREYDYAEAVTIFSNVLETITSYLSTVQNTSSENFRSVETGFSFADLRRAAATLRDIDLDWVSSYIVIHSVSSYDAATEIAYYEWLIENLTRQRTVERTRLASLVQSIEDYEKSPILVAVQDGNSVVANLEDINANYDSMIRERLSSQSRIASYSRSISYYESVIEGFQSAEASTPEDIEKVTKRLADLNEKLNALAESVEKTVDEYYEKVAFSNRIRVLIPASAKKPSLISLYAVLAGAAAVILVLGVYFLVSFLSVLKELDRHRRTDKSVTPEDTHPSGGSE